MATRMLQRRGTAAEWASQNPVLSPGEIGVEIDSTVLKVGDGVTAWNELSSAKHSLNDLLNVNVSAASENDILTFNGTTWVPEPPKGGDDSGAIAMIIALGG